MAVNVASNHWKIHDDDSRNVTSTQRHAHFSGWIGSDQFLEYERECETRRAELGKCTCWHKVAWQIFKAPWFASDNVKNVGVIARRHFVFIFGTVGISVNDKLFGKIYPNPAQKCMFHKNMNARDVNACDAQSKYMRCTK